MTKRFLRLAAALTALSSIASGYYHFVYFSGRSAPFNPVNLHFDLSQLTNNTVYFFISDQGPNVFVPGDSLTAVISELQLAAQSWNIPTSQIQIAYGGIENAATQQTTPGIDVVFDDSNIAVGILAQTKVTTYANISINNNTSFLPILRSRIQFRKNLTVTVPQQASFYDSSFTTMAHEFGHALGLQHTLTSACMSTYTTRSTTKATPLAADDIAGVSLLYPASNYLATVGSIYGNVTLNGSGVNLASVVALSPTTGVAISNLTNPDGSYEIDGIPPGNYLVYVHPLPPAAQGEAGPDAVQLPLDAAQRPFPPNTGFVTQFFPGTREWTEAVSVGVNAGSSVQLPVNFNVQGSAGPVIYGMQLSGGVNNANEFSPILEANQSFGLEFIAPGTVTSNNQLAPGLNVSVIGNQAPASIAPNYTRYYQQGYVSLGVYTSSVQTTTSVPVALAVTVNSDLYVLPAAFYVVPAGPPTISALNSGSDANGNPTVTVYGSSLLPSTRFVFDGALAAASQNPDGSFTLSVPPAPGLFSSSIEALNVDGQTSGQAIPFSAPQQYFYNYANPASITSVSPSQVSPGTDTAIQIQGNNTNFGPLTQVGFGSSDIIVKQIFVINPGLLQVNISVNQFAPSTQTTVTVTTGLQTATAFLGLQIGGASPGAFGGAGLNQITLIAPVTNAMTGLAGVPAGGIAVINTSAGIPQNLTGWTLNIGPQQITGLTIVNGKIQVTVPNGFSPGAVPVQLFSPTGASTPPIMMKIDAPPPVIGSVLNSSGVPVSSTTQVRPGDSLTVNMIGLSDNGITALTVSNLFASLGGIAGDGGLSIPILQFNNPSIQIQIPFSTPNGTLPLYIGIGTRVTQQPFILNIHN